MTLTEAIALVLATKKASPPTEDLMNIEMAGILLLEAYEESQAEIKKIRKSMANSNNFVKTLREV